MSGNTTALFDTIAFESMRPGRYLKVHPYQVTDPNTHRPVKVDPCAGNLYSTGRLARHDPLQFGPPSIAASYVATTGAAALFEALFRNAKILPDHRLYFEPTKLVNMCLSELMLVEPVSVFPAGLPERKMAVTDPEKDEIWRDLIGTADHALTWPSAIDLARQLKAEGKELGGITWNSVQYPQGGAVYVLYDPPNGRSRWTLVQTTRLNTARGHAAIERELRAFGYTWIDSGVVGQQAPPSGAL